MSKSLLLITDAWHPQVNGVVRAYENMRTRLPARGITMEVVHPGLFKTMPLPFYPELRVAMFPKRRLRTLIAKHSPDHIHIAAEGPLGWAARSLCKELNLRYTTTYHTHLQRHLDARVRGFRWLAEAFLRRFHSRAAHTMVATRTLEEECRAMGFSKVVHWPLGVDTDLFVPSNEPHTLEKPVYLFFSRLAPEKGADEFLTLKLPGTKLVVGDGPERARLQRRYKDALFVGYKYGKELAEWIARADVLVFPSRTETFGLAIVEALSCGVPVAAHNEPGPADIITHGVDGYLSEDLEEAIRACLTLDRTKCREKAMRYSWEVSADTFVKNLVPAK